VHVVLVQRNLDTLLVGCALPGRRVAMGETRKRWTGEEIVAVLERVLVKHEELSKVCEEAGCRPSQFYRWQKEFFLGGHKVFNRNAAEEARAKEAQEKVTLLEAKVQRKDQVLAELMEEHVALKKTAGAACASNGSRTTSGTK
jgi:transposase-like protein